MYNQIRIYGRPTILWQSGLSVLMMVFRSFLHRLGLLSEVPWTVTNRLCQMFDGWPRRFIFGTISGATSGLDRQYLRNDHCAIPVMHRRLPHLIDNCFTQCSSEYRSWFVIVIHPTQTIAMCIGPKISTSQHCLECIMLVTLTHSGWLTRWLYQVRSHLFRRRIFGIKWGLYGPLDWITPRSPSYFIAFAVTLSWMNSQWLSQSHTDSDIPAVDTTFREEMLSQV